MIPAGIAPIEDDAGGERDVHGALEDAVHAAERHVVDADDRQTVEIFEPRAERDELQQVRDDVDVDALAARELDDAEHLHVLVDRQRDVDLVDLLLGADLRHLIDRPEHRQPAIADGVGGRRAIVDETDEPEPQLAVLEDAIGHHPPEIAAADDEHAAQSEPRAPAPAQQLAHDLAGHEGEEHVEAEEDHPGRLRHRQIPELALRRIDPILADVQRADHAADAGENAADQHGEEIVDARPSAPQAVEPLHVEGERHEQRQEGQRE